MGDGYFGEPFNGPPPHLFPFSEVVNATPASFPVLWVFQPAGGNISRLLGNFPNLLVLECDGTDFLASYDAAARAVEYVRKRQGPALLHAHVIRPYSHSLSDDERLYKSDEVRQAEAKRDPLARMAR